MTWVIALIGTLLSVPAAASTAEHGRWWIREATQSGFMWGLGAGVLLCVALRRFLPVLPTLEHELTHLLTALLLLRRPLAVRADGGNGGVVYQGRASAIIRLTPYTVPTFTWIGIGLSPFVAPAFDRPLMMILGGTWGYHLIRAIADIRLDQPDIVEGGRLASLLAVVGWGSVLFSASAIAAVGGIDVLRRWAEVAHAHGAELWAGLIVLGTGLL